MKTELELEAEKYYREDVEGEPLTYETPIHCFIAGANSKYVEKQKLEFAIELLNQLEFDPKENILDFVLHIKNKIKELEEKLKQL